MGEELGDIYSMLNKNVNVKFDDLVTNYSEVIKYAGKYSDSFSMISTLKKPYSKEPPNYKHDKEMKILEPFLEQYHVGIKSWPGTITRGNHTVMLVYRSCKGSRKLLDEMPNLFLPIENGLPEDICFFRNQNPWLVTISHEKIAYMRNVTKEDIAFFKENGIKVYD